MPRGRIRLYTDEQRKERARLRVNAWREANRERYLQKLRDWKKNNPDKVKSKDRKYKSKKRAARIAATKQFYLDNPAQCRRKVAR